ncbi:hypothetical protein [Hymenobacter ruricola]|uniref:YtxH domain-containing protein n=1 Tax=Hymenobacter ruricola TaxID=2791023 RepID=A0ABS0HY74_9BACT|nr:hypothetical protein [Hymenobacter ruricola]MBF9219655.1 hypothetical protein [Hymenobacter ruricola]
MAFPLQFFLETVVLPNLLMAKSKKKKHSKKDDASDDILDVAAVSIKKFRKVTKEIGKLSTGQKLVGGIALVAAGLAYLATQEEDGGNGPSDSESTDVALLPHAHHGPRPADDEDDETEAPPKAHHKPRKSSKARPKPGPEA